MSLFARCVAVALVAASLITIVGCSVATGPGNVILTPRSITFSGVGDKHNFTFGYTGSGSGTSRITLSFAEHFEFEGGSDPCDGQAVSNGWGCIAAVREIRAGASTATLRIVVGADEESAELISR